MKTGYMEYDTTTEGSVENAEIAAGDIFVVGNDCGVYNIIFKKPLLNIGHEVCGAVYIHAPNCTLGKDGKYIVHSTNENRTAIAYRQLCDLAKVSYDTNCCDLFKALSKTLYPNGCKPSPNRVKRRKEK